MSTVKTSKLLLAGYTMIWQGQEEFHFFLGQWWNMWRTSMEMKLSQESSCSGLRNTLSGTMALINELLTSSTIPRCENSNSFSKWNFFQLLPCGVPCAQAKYLWFQFSVELQVHLVPGVNPDGYETMSPSGRTWLPLHENANKIDLDTWDDLINSFSFSFSF